MSKVKQIHMSKLNHALDEAFEVMHETDRDYLFQCASAEECATATGYFNNLALACDLQEHFM